jgi:hypothetical protein
VAYVNQDGSAEPVVAALSRVGTAPATVTIAAASLIVLDRDIHMYRWSEHAIARVGSIAHPTRVEQASD